MYIHPIFNILEDFCMLLLLILNMLNQFNGKKTDTKDSVLITDIFKHGLVKSSFMPHLTHEQNSKMKVCLNHYDNILDCINQIEQAILPLLEPYQNEISLILTVPSVKDTAITILSEIGSDMPVFKDAEHLCSWVGLTPQCNESAGKKKSVHISRAGVYLKPLLIQCANNAIRDKKCPYFKLRLMPLKSVEVTNVQLLLLLECYLLAFIKCYLRTNHLITKFMNTYLKKIYLYYLSTFS